MPIGTISDTTWAGASAQARKAPLRVRSYYLARPGGLFFAAELTLLAGALAQAAWARGTVETPILIAACGIFFHLKGLDQSIVSAGLSRFWLDVLESVLFGISASMFLFYLFPALAPRISGALPGALLASLLPGVLRPILRRLVYHKKLVERILIVGTGELVGKLCQALANGGAPTQEDIASGVLSFHENPAGTGVNADCARLDEIVARGEISRIVIAEQDAQSRAKLAGALLDARLRGVAVSDGVDFYEERFGKIWIDALSSEWIVYTAGFRRSNVTLLLKRLIDVTVALLLLLFTAPLLALVAIAIKLDSAGRVLFRQIRVGLHGKTFTILKFRSMRTDAEFECGPVWAAVHDERVTRVGRLLRKFRIDEIPQAINVLRGDMSLVGIRPERPYFVEQLTEEIPFYNLRHYVRPGITGWAQVMYPYGASVEDAYEKLQYDLHYFKHMSMAGDARILLKTIKTVLLGRGR
jgi:sugar transferase (PEP-CTERM system associated)